MNLINKEINQYAEEHSRPESEVLRLLRRETFGKVLKPHMLSGPLQGRLLSMLSKMIRPRNILEIGTFTGYSALCLAEGLIKGEGRLVTIDINEEHKSIVHRYIELAKLENVIEYKTGNALDIIPSLEQSFDLVFIDADKKNNATYFDLVIDKVTQGGYIIIDNVLWKGRVLDKEPTKETSYIILFNKKIQQDNRVENVLLPIRDGLMIVRKNK